MTETPDDPSDMDNGPTAPSDQLQKDSPKSSNFWPYLQPRSTPLSEVQNLPPTMKTLQEPSNFEQKRDHQSTEPPNRNPLSLNLL